jgi:hypothetical protein
MGKKRNAYRLLMGKPEGKRPLERQRSRWVDNIRKDLGDVGWGDVEWIGLAKDRNRCVALVYSIINLRVPRNAGKLSSGISSCGLSNSAQLHHQTVVTITISCPEGSNIKYTVCLRLSTRI